MSARTEEIRKIKEGFYKTNTNTKKEEAVASSNTASADDVSSRVQEIRSIKNNFYESKIQQPAASVNMTERNDSEIRNSYAVRNQLDQAIKDQYSITDPNSTEGKLKNAEIQALKSAVDINKKGRKLEQNTQRVQEVQQQEQRISQQLVKLETTRQGLENLMADYQATGSDVTYQAYMIAYDDYNKQLEAYNKEYAAYQKNAKAYDDYNASRLEYEKAYAGYEKNYGKFETEREKYLEEHPEIDYMESSVEEIEQRISDLRMGNRQIGAAWKSGAVSDEDYKAYREKSSAEMKALQELAKEKKAVAAQTPDGEWGSSAMSFLDRIGLAWDAGIALAHAGNDQMLHKIDQTLYYTAGSFLKMLGAVTRSEKTKEKANSLLEASRKPSASVANAMESRDALMAEALSGAGAIDGWIIKQMESIGSMMFDIWLTGGAQQLAGNVMTSGMPKLGIEKQLGGGYALTTTATMKPALSTTKTMAIRAAGSGMIEAEEKGYSLSEQILYGIASGSLEYLSETMFGGNPIYDEGSGWLTDAMAKTFKNPKVMKLMYSKGFDILSEGFEEVFVSIAQPMAESAITWEKPQMPTAQELAESFAGGLFLSVIGQGASVVATEVSGAGHRARSAYREVGGVAQQLDEVEALIEFGLSADPRTDAYNLANKLQKKLEKGKKLNASEVGKLVFAAQDVIDRGLLVDANMEDNAAAPEGALHDAEDGFYAIQTVQTENGKTGYQIVQVHEDGSVQPVGEQTDDLLAAKLMAEQQGLEIRDIGTAENLQQKAEAMEQEAVLNELAQTERFEEETLQQEAQPVEAVQPAEEVNEPATGLTWAGDENQKEDTTNEQIVSDGGQRRVSGESTGRETGGLSERRPYSTADQSRRATERKNLAKHLRLEKVSSLALLEEGTEQPSVMIMPEEHWDDELRATAELVERETGKLAIFVVGSIPVQRKGTVSNVRGVWSENGIIIQTDNFRVSAEQIAKHEIYHDKAFQNLGLNREIRERIIEQYGEEEFDTIVATYIQKLRGVINVPDDPSAPGYKKAMNAIHEEIFADAYAGINAFGAHAEQYQETVRQTVDQRANRENHTVDTERNNGPPDQGLSWAGEEKTTDRMDGGAKFSSDGYWVPNLTQQENDTVKYIIDHNKGAELTSNSMLFFEQSRGKILFGIYSTDDTTLLYVSKGDKATKEHLFAEMLIKEYENEYVINGRAENAHTFVERLRMQQGAGLVNDVGIGKSRGYAGNGGVHGKAYRRYASPALRSVLENLIQQETNRRNARKKVKFSAVENKTPTDDPDYRFSYDDDTISQEADALQKEIQRRSDKDFQRQLFEDGGLDALKDNERQIEKMQKRVDKLRGTTEFQKLQKKKKLQKAKVEVEKILSEPDRERHKEVIEQHRQAVSKDRDVELAELWRHLELLEDPNYIAMRTRAGGTKAAREIEKERRRIETEIGVIEGTVKVDPKTKKPLKPVQESRPYESKKKLRNTLLSLFNVEEGKKTELGKLVDHYADRMVKNGALTQEDRDHLFDRLYDGGYMMLEPDEYWLDARNAVKKGRIYVSDQVKREFGDDWNDFRKLAFSNQVYLVNDPSAPDVFAWNDELSETLPNLFYRENTEQREILETIVQIAEEGKGERVSLAEYTKILAGEEHISEDELLREMEKKVDNALLAFANNAELEIRLRDQVGVKLANEREKFHQYTLNRQVQEEVRKAKEREDRKAMLQRQKENKELHELQQKTLKQLQWLSKNQHKAPEDLKKTFDEVLGDIDLYAVGAANEMKWSGKYQATWKDLAEMYKKAAADDPNFLNNKELERIMDRLDKDKIADMDIDALRDLYMAAVGLRTEFYNRRNVVNDEEHRMFAEVYTEAKEEIQNAAGGYTGKGLEKWFNMEQLTPMNVLERMGGWNPNGTFYSMAKQLEKGERDKRAYTVKANKHLEEFLTENEDWVKKADGQGKDAIWYEIKVPPLVELRMGDQPIFGDPITVYMTPSQKVHMYLESKNIDNLRHMSGGRTFPDKKLYSEGRRREAFAQGTTIRLAPETVKNLVKDMTEEELELARLLESYYNGFARDEVNRVSNILYGYDKAQNKNYAPIRTDDNYNKKEIGIYDTTAEGVGSLKSRQGYAKNPSYNIGAFDAFEQNVDQIARFVGMAIPEHNWKTLLGWREENNSMSAVISHKWGAESKDYIYKLIETLASRNIEDKDGISRFADKLLSNYISAVFGANPSIVLKQLGSIPLASSYLGARNFPSPAQIKRIDRELIGKYTSELEWRTLGYTTPETKQLKENPNRTETNKFTKFTFGGGAITAMDGWAASVLWPWAENKVRRENPNMEVGTQEQIDSGKSPFYQKVAEAFNEAVNRSQSMSDEMHQSTLRKNKNPIARTFTMFRSDSAQGYNALRQKIGEARYYARMGDKEAAKTAKKAVGGTFLSLIGGYAWAELVSFLIALWKNKGKKYRDDEEELTFGSVAEEMTLNLVSSLAGVVVGGEEVMEIFGNWLTGERWYGIDTPGIAQITDIIELITENVTEGAEVIKGAVEIVNNDGDLVEYLRKHGNDILGSIKELAAAAATYIGGIPVNNLEAYLLGTVKWISPELGAAYDDLMQTIDKSDLSGAEGGVLKNRVDTILDFRVGDTEEETAAELAALYEAGYKNAVPTNTPSQITVNGEARELDAYQQQTYEQVWRESVSGVLDDLVSQEWYQTMDAEQQAKTLAKLYDYAAQSAKSELFEDFDSDSFAKEIDAYQEAGLSTTDYLQAWNRYNEIDQIGASPSEKATEFAYWADSQGYTKDQAQLAKDSFKIYSSQPIEAGKYTEFQSAGLSDRDAKELSDTLSALQPMRGEETVTKIQRLQTIAKTNLSKKDKINAMGVILGTELQTESGARSQYKMLLDAIDDGYSFDEWLTLKEEGLMTDSRFGKIQIARQYGVSTKQYLEYRKQLKIADERNTEGAEGSYEAKEIEAAIEAVPGLSNEQRAALWQTANKREPDSYQKNPYHTWTGRQAQRDMDALYEEPVDTSLDWAGNH